jgi:hypothetical protein
LVLFSGVKAHIAVLGAENDHLSPPALLKQFEEVLTAKSEVRRLNIFSFLFYFISFYQFLVIHLYMLVYGAPT